MKKVWIIILGIFDIIVGAVGSVIFLLQYIKSLNEIEFIDIIPIPFLVGWILACLFGVFTIKKKGVKWGVAGIGAIVLAVVYLMIMVFLIWSGA